MEPTLPRDILGAILDAGSFSKQDLSTISLVSPHLQYEAQLRLFRDPGPHSINVLYEAPDSLVATRLFFEAIAASPDRLALMVRRYHVALTWYESRERWDHDKKDTQNRLFNRFSWALPLMVNLKELQYHEEVGEAVLQVVPAVPPAIWPALKKCSFRLQVFGCSYVGAKSRSGLMGFLRGQEHVLKLWIRENPSPGTTNVVVPEKGTFKDACPSLVSLGGMPELLAGMLEGRKTLLHMAWEKDDYTTTLKYSVDLFHSTEMSTVELLESLRCGPPLKIVGEVFRNLVVLKTCERDLIQVV